jgi:phosphoglycolate phosphatase
VRYHLVIFDFDGTLADSVPWMMGVMDEIAQRHGFPKITGDDLHILRGPEGASMTSRLKIPRWKLPLIARDGRRLMAANLDKISLFQGVTELFQRLRAAGVKLVMVSSNSEANVRRVLGPDNSALIDFFECGASFFGKGRKFRKVMKRCMVAPADILCVGDEVRDVVAATETGLAFGGVTWGLSTGEALLSRGAACLFTSMDEIAQTVLGD